MKPTSKQTFLTEDEVVRQLKEKSKLSLEYIYDRYSGALYSIIIKIVGQNEIAEEILQDTFLKVWDKSDDYDTTKGRLYTWMLNIARNLAIDRVRSKEYSQMNKNNYGFVNVEIEDKRTGNNVEDAIGLDKVLEKLPVEQKVLIELMYFQGYSQSEIAENLDLPLGTVKTRVRNGMLKLREMLQ